MFFEKFRAAAARLPAGLIRTNPAAAPDQLAAAETQLGVALPQQLRSFLLSFDGADLFHGSILIAGAGSQASPTLNDLNASDPVAGALFFAEAVLGDRFTLDAQGRVWRLRAGSDERILAGSGFSAWLDATVAREQLLYDDDGEFAADAFEPDGQEVTARTARRQAERALRNDPGSAEAQHDLGTALRRLGKDQEAAQAFAAAAALDPGNPWPWFDLGRVQLEQPDLASAAVESFRKAAAHERGMGAARLLAWAARAAAVAGDQEVLAAARRDALAHHAELVEDLRRAVDAAASEDDQEALGEAQALLSALLGGAAPAPRRRLPIATAAAPAATRGRHK